MYGTLTTLSLTVCLMLYCPKIDRDSCQPVLAIESLAPRHPRA